ILDRPLVQRCVEWERATTLDQQYRCEIGEEKKDDASIEPDLRGVDPHATGWCRGPRLEAAQEFHPPTWLRVVRRTGDLLVEHRTGPPPLHIATTISTHTPPGPLRRSMRRRPAPLLLM